MIHLSIPTYFFVTLLIHTQFLMNLNEKIGFNLVWILALLFIFYYFFQDYRKTFDRFFTINKFEIFYFIYLIWGFFSIFYSIDPKRSIERFLSLLIIYLLFCKIFHNEIKLKDTLTIERTIYYIQILILFFLSASILLFLYKPEFATQKVCYPLLPWRLKGVFGEFSLIGQLSSIGFVFSIINFKLKENLKSKLLSALLLILSIYSLYLSNSRSGIVGVLFSILTFVFLYIKGQKIITQKIFRLILIGILIYLSIVIVKNNPEAILLYFRVGNETYDKISSGRIHVAKKALELFLERPLGGWGLKTATLIIQSSLDNAYLHILLDTGLMGLFLFLAFCLMNLFSMVKHLKFFHRKSKERIIMEGCVILLVDLLSQSLFHNAINSHALIAGQLLFLTISISNILILRNKKMVFPMQGNLGLLK